MPWFDRHAEGRDADALARELDAAVQRAGVLTAAEAVCGPHGRRRMLVRFERRGAGARVVGLDSERLAGGGGPPEPARVDAGVGGLERALAALLRELPPPITFERGALGVVRRVGGVVVLSFRFDEDADACSLGDVPVPPGAGLPTEDAAYLGAIAQWSARLADVRARAWGPRGEAWRHADGVLDVGDRRVEALALGTWRADGDLWTWWLAEPAGDEAPFREPELTVELTGAAELAVFAAARLGYDGVFSGQAEDGVTFFAATRG